MLTLWTPEAVNELNFPKPPAVLPQWLSTAVALGPQSQKGMKGDS
jgi:hypothetical protein